MEIANVSRFLQWLADKTVDQVQTVVDTFFPDTILPESVQAVLRDLFDQIN